MAPSYTTLEHTAAAAERTLRRLRPLHILLLSELETARTEARNLHDLTMAAYLDDAIRGLRNGNLAAVESGLRFVQGFGDE